MRTHLRTLVWSSLDDDMGHEYFSLYETHDGFEYDSVIAMRFDGKPLRIEYRILLNRDWHTQAVDVKAWQGSHEAKVHLRVDDEKRWWRDAEELVACRGCIDVDVSLTPATNTLPLRRLRLKDGERGEIVTAWIRFPSLEVRPFPQRYTRMTADEYLFESLEDDFKATLKLDDLQLVTDYVGSWRAIASLP